MGDSRVLSDLMRNDSEGRIYSTDHTKKQNHRRPGISRDITMDIYDSIFLIALKYIL